MPTMEPPTEKRDKRRKHLHIADVSKMRLTRPDVIRPIVHMLGLRRPVREIARVCGVSNGTVLEVLNDPTHGPKVQEQRAHFATQVRNALRLGIEATVQKYADPKSKAPPVFDLKMLHDMAALEEGGATQRVEHVHTILTSDSSATLRLLEASHVSVTTPTLEDGEVRLPDQLEGVGMGSQPEKTPALLVGSAAPDGVGECEESLPITES